LLRGQFAPVRSPDIRQGRGKGDFKATKFNKLTL